MQARRFIIITVLIVAAGAAGLFLARGKVKSAVYQREVGRLVDAIPANLESKYGEELGYTMDKFWSCYEEKIVSQNDMTDVMERLRELRSQREIKDSDVFEFIGFVSRCYTDGMNRRHKEQTEQSEGPEVIEQ